MDKILGKLESKDYYKWRFYLSEFQSKEKQTKITELQHQLMLKDMEILKLKINLFQNQVSTAKGISQQAKEEYDKVLQEIEQGLGVTIKGNLVDEVTFEIKQIEEDSKE